MSGVFKKALMAASNSTYARHEGQNCPSNVHSLTILIADDSRDSANTLRSLFDAAVGFDYVFAKPAAWEDLKATIDYLWSKRKMP